MPCSMTTAAAVDVYQALPLPRGGVQTVAPKLVHQGRTYAYSLTCALATGQRLVVDARQLPLDVPALQGQYGEMVLYITSFEAAATHPPDAASLACRYLGPQLSLVFFQELLDRYHLLQLEDEQAPTPPESFDDEDALDDAEAEEEEEAPEDGVAAFQDRYDEVLADYQPLGFPLGPYQSAPLLATPMGTFALGVVAAEQLAQVAAPGQTVFVRATEFSLASFKPLDPPS
jgi:hypothetical protein